MRFRHSSHSTYRTEYHVVWTPRYRREVLVKGVREYLKKIIKNNKDLDGDIEVIRVSIQKEHLHLVLVIPPRVSVANVVKYLKSYSAKKLKEKFQFLYKIFKKPGLWSRGYCVSSIGLNEKNIIKYVEYQEKEDKGQIELKLD